MEKSAEDNAKKNTAGEPADVTRFRPLTTAVTAALTGVTLMTGCAGTGSSGKFQALVESGRAAYVRGDFAKAAEILSEPAMQGDPDAQYALGYMHFYGEGVPRDLYRARSWLETAASHGHRDARYALNLLNVYSKLPPRDGRGGVDRVRELVRAAESKAGVPASNAGTVPPAQAAPAEAVPKVVPSQGAVPFPSVQCTPQTMAGSKTTSPAVVAPAETPEPPSAAVGAAVAMPPSLGAVVPGERGAASVSVTKSPVAAAESGANRPTDQRFAANAAAPKGADGVPPAVATTTIPQIPSNGDKRGAALGEAPQAPTEPQLVNPVSPSLTAAISSENALERTVPQPVSFGTRFESGRRPRFTIHLLSSRSKKDLTRLVQAYHLGGVAGYYMVTQQDGAHYRLIYGGFETLSAAREALGKLPKALYSNRPWINNYPESVSIERFNGAPAGRVAFLTSEPLG